MRPAIRATNIRRPHREFVLAPRSWPGIPLIAAGMQYCIAVIVGDDRETLHLLAAEVLPMLRADAW